MFNIDPYYENQIIANFGQQMMDDIRAELMDIWLTLTDSKQTQNYKRPARRDRFDISLCPKYAESLFHGRFATGFVRIELRIESTPFLIYPTTPEFTIAIYHQGRIELAKRRNLIRCLAGCDQMEAPQ